MSRSTQDTASSPVSFRLHGFHILWPRFPAGSPSLRIGNSTYGILQPRGINTPVWAVPISLAATFGISLIYFPPGTEMVHFPGLTRTDLCIQSAVTWFYQDGFPHSEIPGSKPACGSPRLIAACHVLLRLLAPRHPPYALSSLTIKLTQHVAIAGPWMITHAEVRHRAWSKFAFPHCATLEQIFAVYYAMRDLKPA